MSRTVIVIFFVMMASISYAATFNITAGDSNALISAIKKANTNGQDDVINLAGGIYFLNHVEDSQKPYKDSGLPEIAAGTKLTINGPSLSKEGKPLALIYRLGPAKFRLLINKGDLTLDRIALTNGLTDSGWGGGAIMNLGILKITNCEIYGNQAIEPENAPGIGGGGGAIYDRNGKMTITRTTIINNIAANDGGGMAVRGRLSMSQSLVKDNKAPIGGGIVFVHEAAEAKIVITNSTFTDNEAEQNGGAIYVFNRVVELNHVTVVTNKADLLGGGIFIGTQGIVRTKNSVIGNNFGPNNATDECAGAMKSLGYTLLASNENCSYTSAPGDIVGTDQSPKSVFIETDMDASLGNGYPAVTTFTSRSPAINAIPADKCGSQFDQAGNIRPDSPGHGCDMGAYEKSASPPCLGILGPFKATIVGTAGDNVINGTAGADVINGMGGDDVINGMGGGDTICGGTGKDTIKGNDGNDFLFGGDGDDNVDGGGGNDLIWGLGEVGNNKLFGGANDDTINGGTGDDAIDGGTGADTCNGGAQITQDTKVNCETSTNFP